MGKLTVKDIMVKPETVDKSDTISHALDLMQKYKVRRLLVRHRGDFVGVVGMRDLARTLGTSKKSNLPASALHVVTALNGGSLKYTDVSPDMDIQTSINTMTANNGVLIARDDGEILGWVTPNEILKHRSPDGFAGEIMQKHVTTASVADRVTHVRRIILDEGIGRVPIMNNYSLVGIITEVDIANAMRAFRDLVPDTKQKDRIRNLIASDIMKRHVVTVRTNTPASEVTQIVIERGFGGVPVQNLEDDLVGIITRRNLVAAMATI